MVPNLSLFSSPVWSLQKPDRPWKMSVELSNPNQTAAQIATAVPDTVSLPKEINVASGTWYVVIDLASGSSSFFIKKEDQKV